MANNSSNNNNIPSMNNNRETPPPNRSLPMRIDFERLFIQNIYNNDIDNLSNFMRDLSLYMNGTLVGVLDKTALTEQVKTTLSNLFMAMSETIKQKKKNGGRKKPKRKSKKKSKKSKKKSKKRR